MDSGVRFLFCFLKGYYLLYFLGKLLDLICFFYVCCEMDVGSK